MYLGAVVLGLDGDSKEEGHYVSKLFSWAPVPSYTPA